MLYQFIRINAKRQFLKFLMNSCLTMVQNLIYVFAQNTRKKLPVSDFLPYLLYVLKHFCHFVFENFHCNAETTKITNNQSNELLTTQKNLILHKKLH